MLPYYQFFTTTHDITMKIIVLTSRITSLILLSLALGACNTSKPRTPAPVVVPGQNAAQPNQQTAQTQTPSEATKPVIPPVNNMANATIKQPETTEENAAASPIIAPVVETTETPEFVKQQQQALRKVVILLPDRPSLAEVNRDIEKGIRAAHQQHPLNNALQLIFIHDPLPSDQLMAKAKAFSPDWIIGPLTKGDIQGAQALLDKQQILLNRIDTPTAALQFGLPAEDEAAQLLAKLKSATRPIAIVTSGDATEQRLLTTLQQQASELRIPVYVITVDKNLPDIRDWLLQTGGIQASQKRIERISKLTNTKLETPPHARTDIQALILLGNARQAHAIMPAIQYYRPNWSILATSRLLPIRKGEVFNEPEFNEIQVLTPPYLTAPTGPETPFEALGWDSYQLLGNPQAINVEGMTGKLFINTSNQVVRQLNWQRIKQNQLVPVNE